MNNSDSVAHNATFNLQFNERMAATLILEFIAFLGFIFNGTAVLLTFATQLKKQNINIFFGNMAISDMATCLIFLCGQPIVMMNPDYWPSEYCNWLGFVQFVVSFETVTFIPYLSVNRYIRLCQNQLYDKIYSKRGINAMVVISWIVAFVVVTPYKIGGLTGFDKENLHCCIKYAKDVFWDAYYLCFTFAPIVLADVVALFASFKVYLKMKVQTSDVMTIRNSSFVKEIQLYTVLDVLIPIVLLLPYFAVKYGFADRSVLWVRIMMPCLFLGCPLFRGINVLLILRPYKRMLMKILRCNRIGTKMVLAKLTPGASMGTSGLMTISK